MNPQFLLIFLTLFNFPYFINCDEPKNSTKAIVSTNPAPTPSINENYTETEMLSFNLDDIIMEATKQADLLHWMIEFYKKGTDTENELDQALNNIEIKHSSETILLQELAASQTGWIELATRSKSLLTEMYNGHISARDAVPKVLSISQDREKMEQSIHNLKARLISTEDESHFLFDKLLHKTNNWVDELTEYNNYIFHNPIVDNKDKFLSGSQSNATTLNMAVFEKLLQLFRKVEAVALIQTELNNNAVSSGLQKFWFELTKLIQDNIQETYNYQNALDGIKARFGEKIIKIRSKIAEVENLKENNFALWETQMIQASLVIEIEQQFDNYFLFRRYLL